MTFGCPPAFRVQLPGWPAGDNENGVFQIPLPRGQMLMVVAGSGLGWEHVSVSRKDRCPTWEEMCHVKALFWGDEDCVVQYHPPKSEYVNNHPFCLHLWRPMDCSVPMPPSILVGVKEAA